MANTNQNTVYTATYDNTQTIGRRSHTFHRFTNRKIGGTREQYPTNSEIQRHAADQANRFHEIGYLSKKDIVWSAAIAADVSLDRCSRRNTTGRDKFLEDLIEVGLYDRVHGETRDPAEEMAMRYTSACTSAVMDHTERLLKRVRSINLKN